LLKLATPPDARAGDMAPADLAALPLVRPLAHSFSVAEVSTLPA
jgi:hypothetical protein